MSVFTCVSTSDAQSLLKQFDIGPLTGLEGIASGIENTNYFLSTTHTQYVLTLFEQLAPEELPFFLQLMSHLADHNVPCPHPVANLNGELLLHVCDKPASIVSRLSGKSITSPNQAQCVQVGENLANIHLAGRDFPLQRTNPRGAAWWKSLAPQLLPKLDADAALLLQTEIRYQALHRFQDLPRGIVHADLFRDNALFDGDQLTGVIDFYFACTDSWLYDLAITVNDWCITDDGTLDQVRTQGMLSAYHQRRPLTALERGAWPVLLRAAALRFWVSRLYDFHFPREGELTHAKDPEHFRKLLSQHIDAQAKLRTIWRP
jgi:homoserine kinase type II